VLQLGICLVSIALIAIDQLTKWLAIVFCKGADPMPVINGIVSFTYTENTGAAWSMFEGQRWLLVGGTGVMLAALFVVLLCGMFKNQKLAIAGGILVFAGGLGNLIDRIFRGYVVDFIRTEFMDFPIFNVADCFVVIGAVWLFIYFVFVYSDPSDKKKNVEKTEEELPADDDVHSDAAVDGNET